MSCSTGCDVYNLGCFGHCGDYELPIILPTIGTYYFEFHYQNTILNLPVVTTIINEKPIIDFSLLPVNQELIFKIVKGGNIVTFDIDVNISDPCNDPVMETKSYFTFLLKTVIKFESI